MRSLNKKYVYIYNVLYIYIHKIIYTTDITSSDLISVMSQWMNWFHEISTLHSCNYSSRASSIISKITTITFFPGLHGWDIATGLLYEFKVSFGPVFSLCLSMVEANERRCYKWYYKDLAQPYTEKGNCILLVQMLCCMQHHTITDHAINSVWFLRRPVGPRPATLLSGLQLQKRVGPVGRQLLYLICWAEWSTNVNGYWRNKILFKRYTFIYDPNQHYPEMCTLITRGIEIVSASSIKEIKVLP